ncbi:MAG TPA: oligosaccharide flippase family protein [Propionibacteriaceae bacterium]
MTTSPDLSAEAPPTPRSGSATVSAATQIGARAAHFALNVVSTLAIVRYLAPEAYGSYVLVVTVVTLVGVTADFGLPKLAVREIVHKIDDQNEIIGTVSAIRLTFAVVAMGLCQVVLLVLDEPLVVHQAAAVASLMLVLDAVLGIVVVVFQVHVVQQYEALVRVAAEALETALILILIAMHVSLLGLFVPPVIGLAFGAALAYGLARFRFGLRPRPVRSRVRHLVVEALPLGPALIISVLYLKLDSLILAAMRPPRDLGVYASAYQPVEYAFLATGILSNVMFPMLARAWAEGDRERFRQMYRRGTELLVIATALAPILLAFTAPSVIKLVFGSAYLDAASPLRILSIALVTMSVNAWQALVLLSGGEQRITLIYNAGALAFALVGCTVGVWLLGLVGAAVSALATSLIVLVASQRAVRHRMGAALDHRQLLKILTAAGGAAGVAGGLYLIHAHWVVIAVVTVIAYAVALHRFGFHRSIREVYA